MAIATLAEVKAALGISGTDRDAQIGALLDPFTALIERTAGRAFSPAEVTERHMGGEPTLALRRWPVADGSPGLTVTDRLSGTVLAADDYELEPEAGLLRRLPLGSHWARSTADRVFYLGRNVPTPRWEVRYVGGPVSAPDDIKLALYYAIAATVGDSGGVSGLTGLIAEKDGDYSYQRAMPAAGAGGSGLSLPANAMEIVRAYKTGVFI